MLITKQSMMSGKYNSMEIPITMTQFHLINQQGRRTLIQEIVPNLTSDQREFLMTGATPEEWDNLMMEDEE